VDSVIAALPDKMPKPLTFLKMVTSPLVFICPRRFPDILVYKDGRIDWEKTPMILADVGLSRERMDLWFAKNQIVPNIYSRVAGHEAIIALVNLGCGLGLVPRLVLEKSPFSQEIAILDGVPELPPYEIGLFTIQKHLINPKIQALWTLAGQIRKTT
jgi:LysR family positive regulator for ilvC